MKLHWKLVLIPCLSLVVVLLTLAWRTEQLILEDKTQFSLDAAEKQLNPLKRVISDRVAASLINLQRSALAKELGENDNKLLFGDFQAISLFSINNNNRWTPQWTIKEQSSRSMKWPEGLIKKFGESLPFAKIKKNEVYWGRVSTGPSDSYVMLATRVTIKIQGQPPADSTEEIQSLPEGPVTENREVIMLGVFKKNWIQDFVNDYRGSYEEVIVFNELGIAQAHTSISLIGKDLSATKIVKESVANRNLNQPREYEDKKGDRFFGITDRIPLTNLYTSIALPKEFIFRVNSTYRETLIATGTGALIIVFILVFLIGQNFSIRAQALTRFVEELSEKNYDLQLIPKSKDELGLLGVAIAKLQSVLVSDKNRGPSVEDYQTERMEAYSQLGKGIVGTLKEPLMTILGHAQMARSKAPDETKDNYVVIEREVRRAKSIIEKLGRFSGLDLVDHIELELEPIVESTLKNLSDELESSGVDLLKSINEVEKILGHENQIRTIINSICMNAAEAMKESETKEIRVGLSQRDSYIRLSFEDTGPGMSGESKARLFEPFYSLKENDENLGLGMALVLGIVNEHGAKISVHSEQGQGTQIFIDFPSARIKDSLAKDVLNQNLDLPSQSPSELSGAQALDGQEAEQLPVGPGPDEITFVGNEESFIESTNVADEGNEVDSDSNILNFDKYSKKTEDESLELNESLELDVDSVRTEEKFEFDKSPSNEVTPGDGRPEQGSESLDSRQFDTDIEQLEIEPTKNSDIESEEIAESETSTREFKATEDSEVSVEVIGEFDPTNSNPVFPLKEQDEESKDLDEEIDEDIDEPLEEETKDIDEEIGFGGDDSDEEEHSPIHQIDLRESQSSPSLQRFEEEIEKALEKGGTAEIDIANSDSTSDHIESEFKSLDDLEDLESSSTVVASKDILDELNNKVIEPPQFDEVSDEESDPFYPSKPNIHLDELNKIEDRSHLPKKPSAPPKSYLQEKEEETDRAGLEDRDNSGDSDTLDSHNKGQTDEGASENKKSTRIELRSRRDSKLKVRKPKRK